MKTREQYRHQVVDDSTATGINTVGLGELLDLAASLKHEGRQAGGGLLWYYAVAESI